MLTYMKRLAVDFVIVILLIVLFLSKEYLLLPPALQTVALKSLLVSAGFMMAHITGKLAFPKVIWRETNFQPVHCLRIALYVIFIYAYSIGG